MTALTLTPRQLEVLQCVRSVRAASGTSPTLSEMAVALGLHKSTIHEHVRALEVAGALSRTAYGGHRALLLTAVAEEHLREVG